MSEPSKPTLDYAKPDKPRYSRWKLASLGFLGALFTLVGALAVLFVVSTVVGLTLGTWMGGPDDTDLQGVIVGVVALLEMMGLAYLGFRFTRPTRDPATRAFGLGLVTVWLAFIVAIIRRVL